MKYMPDDIVKSCRKLESGLRFGQEGIHACQLGPFCAPIWWTADEAGKLDITKEMLAQKREELFNQLNDEHSDIACKHCAMVAEKSFKDVKFTGLGHVDIAAETTCNLRCSFCSYTVLNSFAPAQYKPLDILYQFSPEDVDWDAAVDFNGGEPTLLKDMDEYITYFNDRRIRVFLYTNSLRYKQSVYDGLVKGSIPWVVTSLDAGTPSTFKSIKKSDKFIQTLQTLTRYAHAGSQGGGRLSVKYIFFSDNCSEDDIVGFTYAMLAIKPQKVWLTFDFEPLQSLPGDSGDFGDYDYSRHIAAYAKMFVLMKRHGLDAGHFTENHLAAISRSGKILMEKVKAEIDRLSDAETENIPELLLPNFREIRFTEKIKRTSFESQPLRIKSEKAGCPSPDLKNKRILIAPSCPETIRLISDPGIMGGIVLGFLDRDTVLQGKTIEGITVYGYEEIENIKPDIVLVGGHLQHRQEILASVAQYSNQNILIAEHKGN